MGWGVIKKILIYFVVFIFLIAVGYMLKDTKVDRYIKYKLNYPQSELSDYYYKLLAIHERQDLQVGKGSTIMIGDSITPGIIYPRFVNYGIGSDTTYGVLNRLEKYKSLQDAEKIILMIGINDLKRRSDNEILKNYQQIIDQLPNDKLVVFSIIPVNEEVVSKNPLMNNIRIKKLNIELANLCNKNSVQFIDISEYFSNEDGYLDSKYHMGDGIHLNEAGYKIWIKYLDKI